MSAAAASAAAAPAAAPAAENGDLLLKEYWPNSMPPIDGVVEVMVGDRPCRCRRRDLERATVYSNASKLIKMENQVRNLQTVLAEVLDDAREQAADKDKRIARLEAIVDSLLMRKAQDPHPVIEQSVVEEA